jgi:hypothetical protein
VVLISFIFLGRYVGGSGLECKEATMNTEQHLQGKVSSCRGGLQLWRDLVPIIEKCSPEEVAALNKLFDTAHEEGMDDGRSAMRSKAIRLGRFGL